MPPNKLKQLENILKKIKCTFFQESFYTAKEQQDHRRREHPTFKPCRSIENCPFKGECYYSNIKLSEGVSISFQCGRQFSDRGYMHNHRKTDHEKHKNL